jgi:acylphosphatase
MAKIARRCVVSGRVQGVGYRYFAAAAAEDLEVTGYAKNLADGRVEVFIQGEEEDVLAMLDRLREGPRWSHVEALQVEVLEPTKKYRSFQITG